jgi:hypothetical protein
MAIPTMLLLLGLAQARLTWLVVDDEISRPFRAWTIKKWGKRGMIPYLVHCPWCSGFWVSTALCGFSYAFSLCSLPVALLLIPAVAYAGAIIRSMIEE